MFEALIIALISAAVTALVLLGWRRRANPVVPIVSAAGDDRKSLHALIDATFGSTGETFFYALVRELAQFLEVDVVLLASSLDQKQGVYRSLAYWCNNGYQVNQTLSLLHSPCEQASGLCLLEQDACQLYPESALLRAQFDAVGFFGIRLLDSSGNTVGLLAGMHSAPLNAAEDAPDIIKMFAARAASELERKQSISEMSREKERAQITLHSIGDGVITTDSSGFIDYMNPVAETMTGWRFHQAMGMSMEAIFHLEDEKTGQVVPDPAQRCLLEKRVISPTTDNVLIARNGERYSIQGTAAPMLDARANCIGVALVFKDVTDSRRMQKMMVHQATHDPLTGLVNRAEFEQRLEQALESAREFDKNHALLFMDLDQFKPVNDSAGHAAGDELLKQITALIASQLRGRDTLGRLGGDEFSVLLENCPVSKAVSIAEVLIDVVREYRFVWEAKTYQVGMSIGIVSITPDSLSTSQLMSDADQACYSAKDLGRGRAHVYAARDSDLAQQQGELLHITDLREALESQSFELFYQPILPLDLDSTQLHTRVEVLLRMLDQTGGYITPGAFLPAAERFGLMKQVDRWVVGKLFNDYAHIFVQNPDLVLSLNLTANSVADETLADFVAQLFADTVVLPHQVCFEISETALFNDLKAATLLINRLREMGCSIAIDDFGSGLSSFALLKQLSVDFIKIDGNLIRDLGMDAIDNAMVEAINAMAQILGIKTIAESADSEEILLNLKRLGVNYAQGYYLGSPVSMEEMGQLKHQSQAQPSQSIN